MLCRKDKPKKQAEREKGRLKTFQTAFAVYFAYVCPTAAKHILYEKQ